MSKNNKSGAKTKSSEKNVRVNTLGIDVETGDVTVDDAPSPLAEKVIGYATLALSMLLLGGSIVFWWIILRYLTLNPEILTDAAQMTAVLVCCATVPLIVTVIQSLRKKTVSVERWLICMCVSGAVSALLVVLYQLVIRDAYFTFKDFPTLLCCTVSGAALPSVVYLGVCALLPRIAPYFRSEPYTRARWEEIKRDVLALTDFDVK